MLPLRLIDQTSFGSRVLDYTEEHTKIFMICMYNLGARLNMRNRKKETALTMAEQSRQAKSIAILKAAGDYNAFRGKREAQWRITLNVSWSIF